MAKAKALYLDRDAQWGKQVLVEHGGERAEWMTWVAGIVLCGDDHYMAPCDAKNNT